MGMSRFMALYKCSSSYYYCFSCDEERTATEIFAHTRATVNFDGSVFWSFPVLIKSFCKFKPANYPFDTQSCPLIFGSWNFNTLSVSLSAIREHREPWRKRSLRLIAHAQSINWPILRRWLHCFDTRAVLTQARNLAHCLKLPRQIYLEPGASLNFPWRSLD